MSRLDHDTNEWLCKIVLFGPPTAGAVALARQVIDALPAAECDNQWEAKPEGDATLVARYRPTSHTLNDIQPVYSIHALRSAESTAVDRQHLLGNVDGVVLLIDSTNLDQSRFAERELERFLGMFGKMIATMPVVFLADTTLAEDAQATLNPGDKSLFIADGATSLLRVGTTLTQLLEQDSGFAGFGFDLDDFGAADDDDDDDDDIEFDDLHAYDDDE